MNGESSEKKEILDQFDLDFFTEKVSDANKVLNKVGKVNVGWNTSYFDTLPSFDMIVDVGAADDFVPLHKASMNKYSVLIDANKNYADLYSDFLVGSPGVSFITAISDKRETLVYRHYPDSPYLSSTSERQDLAGLRFEEREMVACTIDELVDTSLSNHGILLKLDIEGGEYKALRGAKLVLPRCSAVICEISLDPKFPGGEDFRDVQDLLASYGLYLKDILRVPRLKHNSFPAQIIDAVFAR